MKFLIVGDSHTQYFGLTTQLRSTLTSLKGIKAVTKTVSASTISGVGKMDSTLKLGNNIHHWLDEHEPDFLVLNLGQVDVELGIPFRQFVKQYPEPSSHWTDYFIHKYDNYLSTVPFPRKRIIIKGINLPVLCYDQQKAIKYITRIVTERFSSEANHDERREIITQELNEKYPSDIVRSDLARHFNKRLSRYCDEMGYGYFDINSDIEGDNFGIIHERFVPAKFDHHIIDSLEVRKFHWETLLSTSRQRYWN